MLTVLFALAGVSRQYKTHRFSFFKRLLLPVLDNNLENYYEACLNFSLSLNLINLIIFFSFLS